MKYIYKNENEIIKISDRLYQYKMKNSSIIYADEKDKPINTYKDLVIEEKPNYNPETQELISYFEDGKVIRKKYRIVEKELQHE